MPDRLSALDVSFLYLEEPASAMHTGSVMIFDGAHRWCDYERISAHIEARVAFVPRYRQRVRWVPGRLANPVWVDDESFDIARHVRRSALPRPGSAEQLAELVARVQARVLPRDRPLWELFVVEGLAEDRFAIITKVHQAMVDGEQAVDLGQVVLDASPEVDQPPPGAWRPAPEPSLIELVAGAVADSVRRPRQIVETVRAGAGDVRSTAAKALGAVGSLAQAARSATRALPSSPLDRDHSDRRAFATLATDLADYRRIREANTGTAVNDVVLAALAGGLRNWLLTRGEPVPPGSTVRALVPVSVRALDPQDRAALGSRVASLLVDLPTGEASPRMRLHQVAFQTKAHRDTGQAVDAPAIAGMAGFAPPTLHALGARVASSLSRRMFSLVITNVPGPQIPLYLEGARMLASHPVVPLAQGSALSIGLTSYAGGVYYGLYADAEAMPDLDVLAQCIRDAVAELQETT